MSDTMPDVIEIVEIADVSIPGPIGDAGPQGPPGEPGPMVSIVAQVATVADLPAPDTVDPEDGYVVTADGNLYLSDGVAWMTAAHVVGPPGPVGPQGPQGIQGVPGPAGATGAGIGIPAGGTTGQTIVKTGSADFATAWGGSPIVSKATTPTAADYGLTTIPVGAIWVQTP